MQTDVRELLARMQICHVEVNGLLDVPHEGEGGPLFSACWTGFRAALGEARGSAGRGSPRSPVGLPVVRCSGLQRWHAGRCSG
jgi:hypothetical protein